MSTKEIITFTDFMWFYNKYKPLTPYGLTHKGNYTYYTNLAELNTQFDTTETLVNFLSENDTLIPKIENHLTKIDSLNSFEKECFDTADLFLIKKLLINHKAISSLLPDCIKNIFDFKFQSDALLASLCVDNNYNDTFYLSSNFSFELKHIRTSIKNTDQYIANIKQDTIDYLKKEYLVDFSSRDFILIKHSQFETLDSNQFYSEIYDANLILIKPIFPPQYMEQLIHKKELLQKETILEKQVLQRLSDLLNVEKKQIINYTRQIEQLDIHLAKAQVANQYQLTRPTISNNGITKVTEGKFLPLLSKHEETGLKYKPLNVNFLTNATLLSGANMGGKTVLFKTLGFLQLITQMGFYVPAQEFVTHLYDEILVLGSSSDNQIEGLSSFGQEIFNLCNALTSSESTKLLFVDELAKTTNATEAKAILYAVLKLVSNHKNITGYFSTHFINIPLIEGVSKYKMKGLDHHLLKKSYQNKNTDNIQEKIKLINTFMQYEIEEDNGENQKHDALIIAKMLGLNSEIIKHANKYLDKNYGTI